MYICIDIALSPAFSPHKFPISCESFEVRIVASHSVKSHKKQQRKLSSKAVNMQRRQQSNRGNTHRGACSTGEHVPHQCDLFRPLLLSPHFLDYVTARRPDTGLFHQDGTEYFSPYSSACYSGGLNAVQKEYSRKSEVDLVSTNVTMSPAKASRVSGVFFVFINEWNKIKEHRCDEGAQIKIYDIEESAFLLSNFLLPNINVEYSV